MNDCNLCSQFCTVGSLEYVVFCHCTLLHTSVRMFAAGLVFTLCNSGDNQCDVCNYIANAESISRKVTVQ